MNPLALRAQNLRSYPSLEFEFPDGITAVTGSNGAGKSTLLAGIELALFADGARDLAPALGPFSEKVELELIFEHDSEEYRVRRSYGKKTTLDFEQRSELFDPDGAGIHSGWEPLTRESTAETQRLIEQTLGLNRATFNASAFLAQGNSAAFPEASPAERKALLGTILDPRGLWPSLAERATTDRKQAEQALAAQQARIADREPVAAEVPERFRELDKAGIAVQQADANYTAAEETYEVARAAVAQNEAAAERYRGAVAAEETARAAASKAQQALGEARMAAHKATEGRGRLGRLKMEADQIPSLEALAEKQRGQVAENTSRLQAIRNADERIAFGRDVVSKHEREHAALFARWRDTEAKIAEIAKAEVGAEHCDRCGQVLDAQAKETALANIQRELLDLSEQVNVADTEVVRTKRALKTYEETRVALPEPNVAVADDYSSALAAARRAHAEHVALTATLAYLETEAAKVPELEREASDAEHALFIAQTATELARAAQVDPDVLAEKAEAARHVRSAKRVDLDDANTAHTRAQTALQTAQDAARELADLRRDVSASLAQLATYRLAERAYGRDGVPALIAENTAGVIEAEANRVLERLPTASGTTFRVELRTQKTLKSSDALRETLDILVSDRTTTREFLTFSGGERFRVSFALRWALAKLLAGRRGAESRLLVIDEPDGLDAGGMDGLAAVLRENSETFSKVMIVSHSPLLATAFERVVEVQSDGDVSRLIA